MYFLRSVRTTPISMVLGNPEYNDGESSSGIINLGKLKQAKIV